jgi:hypothetical protein
MCHKPQTSLRIFIDVKVSVDIILLTTLWLWGLLSPNRKDYLKIFMPASKDEHLSAAREPVV